jgi:hypothetical protein
MGSNGWRCQKTITKGEAQSQCSNAIRYIMIRVGDRERKLVCGTHKNTYAKSGWAVLREYTD